MGHVGIYFILSGKIRSLIEIDNMNVKNVVECWNKSENEEPVRVCEQVKIVVGMWDKCTGSAMSQSRCEDILTFYVLESVRSWNIWLYILYIYLYVTKEFKHTNYQRNTHIWAHYQTLYHLLQNEPLLLAQYMGRYICRTERDLMLSITQYIIMSLMQLYMIEKEEFRILYSVFLYFIYIFGVFNFLYYCVNTSSR